MCCIQIRGVSVFYDRVCAIQDVDLNIEDGDFMAIIGPNGGGKTTLLKVIMGLITPSEGSVVRDDTKRMGYVPQFTSFDKSFPINVMDVVLMGRLKKPIKLFSRYSSSDISAAEDVLGRLGLIDLRYRQIGQLSGGQLQKVLIARALCLQPDILLLDEPTANIDSNSSTEIYKLLKDINGKMTIVMVSHDIGVMASYVKTIACINKRLYYHGDSQLDIETLNRVYGCPIDLIAHGVPHRVLEKHREV